VVELWTSGTYGKQVYIFASFSRDMESDTNRNFQIELSCYKILGFTLLVPFDCHAITVGTLLLSRDEHCHSFIMRNY